MTNSIKIKVPAGMQIDKEKSTFEHIVFKKVNKILSWEQLETIEGYFIDSDSSIVAYAGSSSYTGRDKNIFATHAQAEALLAFAQLSQLMQKANNGWVPDYSNNEEEKYSIEPYDDKLKKVNYVSYHCFLTFKTENIRKEFFEAHNKLIRQFYMMGY